MLPENRGRLTLAEPVFGDIYVVTWAIAVDRTGQGWIRPDYPFTETPQETSHLRIRRISGGFEVNLSTASDATWVKGEISHHYYVPVWFRESFAPDTTAPTRTADGTVEGDDARDTD